MLSAMFRMLNVTLDNTKYNAEQLDFNSEQCSVNLKRSLGQETKRRNLIKGGIAKLQRKLRKGRIEIELQRKQRRELQKKATKKATKKNAQKIVIAREAKNTVLMDHASNAGPTVTAPRRIKRNVRKKFA